ncbi:MAG: hypothetical protein M1369_01150 [Deinococcus sp.]|nr:hypothetical protein [Deinococcus sp.]MCL5964380.1 hypothetical protein [Deinococcus sp.]
MKRLLALPLLLLGFAQAQVPAYPENTFGVGYALDQGITAQAGLSLPFGPLGVDTGLDLEVAVGSQVQGWSLLRLNLLPALTISDLSLSAGLGLDLRYGTSLLGVALPAFGVHLGPVFTFELPSSALSGFVGIGYQNGFHAAYGLGLRVYLDPVALDIATSDRYTVRVSLLYLW